MYARVQHVILDDTPQKCLGQSCGLKARVMTSLGQRPRFPSPRMSAG